MFCPQIHSKVLKMETNNKCSIVLPYSHCASLFTLIRQMRLPFLKYVLPFNQSRRHAYPKMNNRHQQNVVTLFVVVGVLDPSVAKRKELL